MNGGNKKNCKKPTFGLVFSSQRSDIFLKEVFKFFSDNNPTGETQPLYNGNIAQTIWKTASDNTQRGYNYTYDRLNRLRRADFYKQGAGNLTAYGEFITYDLNGNIT